MYVVAMSLVHKYNYTALQSVLKGILFFDVIQKPLQVGDLRTFFGTNYSSYDEIMQCLSILEDKDIIEHSVNGYTLYGRLEELNDKKSRAFFQ